MEKKFLIKIINEEISGFDFLGNEQNLKEEDEINLLSNEDFQKQFICDFLLNKTDKIKTLDIVQSDFGDNWENKGYLTVDYIIEFSYKYDVNKEPATFGFQIKGDRIDYSEDRTESPGDYSTAPYGEASFNNIDWGDIDVKMFMVGERDDNIEFLAFEHAPERIKNLFVRELIGDFIAEWTGMGMKTPTDYDSVEKTGYC